MSGIFVQAPAATIMIRPTRFRPIPATREDYAFQTEAPDRSDHEIAAAVFRKVTDGSIAVAAQRYGVRPRLEETGRIDRPVPAVRTGELVGTR